MVAPSHGSRRRLLAGFVALYFLAGCLGLAAHEALVRHVVCPLHGELLEVVGASRDGAPASRAEPPGVELEAATHALRLGHALCAVALEGRGRSLQVPTATAVVACPLPRIAPPLFRAQRPPPAFPLYRLAPKLSPPVPRA